MECEKEGFNKDMNVLFRKYIELKDVHLHLEMKNVLPSVYG